MRVLRYSCVRVWFEARAIVNGERFEASLPFFFFAACLNLFLVDCVAIGSIVIEHTRVVSELTPVISPTFESTLLVRDGKLSQHYCSTVLYVDKYIQSDTKLNRST
jgi:hypothetical protein